MLPSAAILDGLLNQQTSNLGETNTLVIVVVVVAPESRYYGLQLV